MNQPPSSNLASLKQSVVVITGGAGHIGKETAKRLAVMGVRIAVVDKNRDAANAWVTELKKTFGTDAIAIIVDLLDPASFKIVRDEIETKFGRADFLVNNAAFYDDMPGWGVGYEEEGYEAWMKVMQVNLLAPFFLTQALTPLLKKSPFASIVNVSSMYGTVGPDHRLYEALDMTNPAAYSASKGGLNQITKWLSTVLAPQIRVNTVSPGGLQRGQPEAFIERYVARTPLQRMANECDVAGTIAFLLSPDSAYITGQNIMVDGGWSVW